MLLFIVLLVFSNFWAIFYFNYVKQRKIPFIESPLDGLKKFDMETWGWHLTEIISSESSENSLKPSIAIDDYNNIFIVWGDKTNFLGSGPDEDIFFKCWNATTKSWMDTIVVSIESTSDSSEPVVEVDLNGNVHVVWFDSTNYNGAATDLDIFYKCWNCTTGVWSPLEVVTTFVPYDSKNPAISVDAFGKVHVVWQQSDMFGADWDIHYKSKDPISGIWSAISAVSTEGIQVSFNPTIDVDKSGNVHVAWEDWSDYAGAGEYDFDIFYKYKDKITGLWTITQLVSSGSTEDSWNPTLKVDELENIHIVWDDSTDLSGSGSDSDIFYRCWNATTSSWTSIDVLSTESTGSSKAPTINVDGTGNLYTVWHDGTNYNGSGSDSDIFFKWWNHTTNNWSITEVISTESTSASLYPTLIIDKRQFIHITWYDYTNYKGVGTDADIFYKSYIQIPSAPILTPILPNPDTNGIINLNWTDISEANIYYIYKSTSNITSINEMIPISTTIEHKFQDIITKNETYYYVIVAGNALGNSSISNCENVTIAMPIPSSPILNSILPNPNINGIIELNWSYILEATTYYVFRSNSDIISIDGLTPITAVYLNNYHDINTVNGTYYYVIVAGNAMGNSSISNCESVNVTYILTLPNTPVLNTITPNPDNDGLIELIWNEIVGSSIYYIYRAPSFITSIAGLSPIIIISTNNYIDFVELEGSYYYVIMAGNILGNSSLSNCENVRVIFSWNWTPIEVISLNSVESSSEPSIAADNLGNLHISWIENDDEVFYKRWNATIKSWTPMEQIFNNLSVPAYSPSVATDPFNNLHIVWAEDNPTYDERGIFYKCWNISIGNWSEAELISTESANISTRPSLAVDSNGNIHVVWFDRSDYDGAGPDFDIFHKYWNATTHFWTLTDVVSTESVNESNWPICTTDVNNNLHVVWIDESDYNGAGLDDDTFYKRWNATTQTWTLTEVISIGSSEQTVWKPEIAVDIAGNVHIIWSEWFDIAYRRWDTSTKSWSGIEILDEGGSMAYFPGLISDNSGNVHLVWTQGAINYKSWNIYDKFWSPLQIIDDSSCTSPELTVDGAGSLYITWTDSTNYNGSGTDSDIFLKRRIRIPNAPSLNQIIPNPNHNGIINLNWNSLIGVSRYYIFKDTSYITSTKGKTPEALVFSNSYQDLINTNNTYF